MQNFLMNLERYAPFVLRLGLSLVFLWFGSQQLLDGENWVGLVPESIASISGISALTLVYINGIFEIVFGIALLLGIFTRWVALLLALHVFHIVSIVGYNDVGVRDFGLAMALLSIFMRGHDFLCLMKKY
jgi:uncharacterized membrane protein YphA (DoxX/SURF4 family)